MTQTPLLRFLCAALVVTACQAPPQPAPAPTSAGGPPVDTSGAPQSEPVAGPTAAGDPRSEVDQAYVRGSDECQSGPDFELTYAPSRWVEQELTLRHRDLPGCSLLLAAHGQQVAGPKIEERKDLAGFAWQVSHFPSEGLSSYWLEASGGCYLFEARHGSQAPVESTAQCQQAADAVIDTFRLLEPQAN